MNNKLTYTDGPLIGLGIELLAKPTAGNTASGSVTYAEGLTPQPVRLRATEFNVISEPNRRATNEKVARGIAKLFYHINAKQCTRFGRGVQGMQFTVRIQGVTPGCMIDYHFSLTIDEILGTR